ncbi:CocE/NonD family hydrolase [Kitasatospora sp. NBC_00458]|uniref:CocE/NonD family hydrolase n=1 Tax=Kitasatospora sp. NBC_00458 TaxID=2903568 RepID=UPI002E197942
MPSSRHFRRPLIALLAAVAALTCSIAPAAADPGPAAGGELPRLRSLYVAMPDGVRIAADVWLPPGATAGSRLPTVLETSRYWRSRDRSDGSEGDPRSGPASVWNARGYAYVVTDLRGTGASFGTLDAELGTSLIKDSGALGDWIAAQPWSNGRVGTTGVSYGGDTAILALGLRNHHITAAAPNSYDFDPYEDLIRPGGLLIEPRVAVYSTLLRILDQAGGTTCATSDETRRICDEYGLTGLAPRPVDGPDGPALRAAARVEHAGNANLVDLARKGAHRDYTDGPQSWAVTSVAGQSGAIQAGGVPVLTDAGWLDAGTPNGVLSQFSGLSNTQESWIGPWNHGQGYLADPFQPSRRLTDAERREIGERTLAFFDRYVRDGEHPDGERLVHYYTLNEGTWRTTDRWPVPGTRNRRLYLADGNTLSRQPPRPVTGRPDTDPLTLHPTAGTGPLDRWNTNLTGDPVSYPDRAAVDRDLLSYTSPPVRQDTRVTGLGRVTLDVTGVGGASDGALHVYLEDVAPDGRVTYITEGQLALTERAVASRWSNPDWRRLRTPRTFAAADAAPFPQGTPQRVTLDLQPTSVLFKAGDRIRLTVAAANPDSFELRPADGRAAYTIGHGSVRPSYVDLPVVG